MGHLTSLQQYKKYMDSVKKKVAAECEDFQKRLTIERAKYPPRRIAQGWTDTYWDGSFGPLHPYEIWTAPDPDPLGVLKDFDKESIRIQRREDKKAYGDHKHVCCTTRKCYWHE